MCQLNIPHTKRIRAMSYLKFDKIVNPSAVNIAMVTDILDNAFFGSNLGIGTGGGGGGGGFIRIWEYT